MDVKWIEHKGRRILYVDYRGAKNEEEMLSVLYKSNEEEKASSEKVTVLANFENTYASSKYMDEVNRLGKEVTKNIVDKTALIGIVGIKKILVNSFIRFTGDNNLKIFDNEDNAKEWLVS